MDLLEPSKVKHFLLNIIKKRKRRNSMKISHIKASNNWKEE